MPYQQRKLWPEFEKDEMADRSYINELVGKLGLPQKLADFVTLTSYSDGTSCVKIEFTLEPEEVCCALKLKQKFGG